MVSGAEDIKPVISDRQHKEEQTKEQKQEEKQEGQQPEQNSDQQAQTSEVTEKVVEIPVEKVVEKVVEKEKIVQIEKTRNSPISVNRYMVREFRLSNSGNCY